MLIAYLGPLEVRVDDGDGGLRPAEVPGRRLRSLLGRLAVDVGAAVGTDELVAAVWGDDAPAEPLGALQALVSRLRRVLGGPGAVEQSAAGYRLGVEPGDVDAVRFTRAVGAGERALAAGDPGRAAAELGDALALLRGDPLPDADDDAAAVERSRVAALADRARGGRAEALLALGRPAEALAAVVPGAQADPLREDLARWRMAALAALGRDGEALVVFERTRAALADQLGADPSPALAAEHLRVLRGEGAPRQAPPAALTAPTAPTALTASTAPPGNLPARASSFLGRDDETSRLRSLLGGQRLVTVLGPGGAGKTSLAVETARAVAAAPGAPTGGVWLVELAPVTADAGGPSGSTTGSTTGSSAGSAAVDAAVVDALGGRETRLDRRPEGARAASTRERVLELLEGADALLVLDNCEHVVGAAADLVAALLARCPRVRVLATSREPLAVGGEHLLPLAPLAVPAPSAPPEQVAASPAVQLLLQRAAAAGSELGAAGTGSSGQPEQREQLEALAEVARRLDGLPLALELAAARLRTLTPAEVVARLDDRFQLLARGPRTAVARHRTLRAVVEWSWDLLDDDDRDLAERCAVFAGGVTAPALAAVAALGVDEAADRLQELADRSLLVPQASATGTRYRMLETLREFGTERLAVRGALLDARDRHAAWAGALAAEADAGLRTREQRRWTGAVDAARDDLEAALAHLAARGRGADAVDLAVHLAWYGSLREDPETFRWCEVALGADGAAGSPLAPVARAVGRLHRLATAPPASADAPAGAPDASSQGLVDAAADLDAVLDVHPAVPVLQALLLSFAGRPELAGRAVERGLAAPDPWTRAVVRQVRAALAENVGDLASVRRDVAVGLAEWEALGDEWGIASTLVLRAQLRTVDGDVPGAVADLERADGLLAGVAGTADQRLTHVRLADLRSRAGDVAGARRELALVRTATGPASRPFALLAAATAVGVEQRAGDAAAAAAALDALERELAEHVAERRAAGPGSARDVGREHGLAVALAAAAAAAARSPAPEVRDRAREHLADAHRTGVATGDGPIVAAVATAAVEVAVAAGRLALAARLLGAARVLRGADDLSDPRRTELVELLAGSAGAAAGDADGSREQALDLLAGAVAELAGTVPGR